MTAEAARVVACRIGVPFARAAAFLRDPANWAGWASGMGEGLRREGGAWVAEGPEGPVRIRFAGGGEAGVFDHEVELPGGGVVRVPFRLVPDGAGCEARLTLLRQPGMDEARFAADAAWMARDLARLKALLES